MNVINRVAFQSLKKNRTRSIVTIIGVILSVALMTAVSTTVVSFQEFMASGSIAQNGEWHLEFYDVDEDLVNELSGDPEVASVATVATLEKIEIDDDMVLTVQAYSSEAFDKIPLRVSEGRLPESSEEIVLSRGLWGEDKESYQVGDAFSRSAKNYTIVGFVDTLILVDSDAPWLGGVTMMDRSASPNNILNARVSLVDMNKVYEVGEKYGEQVGVAYNNNFLRFYGLSTNDNFMTVFYGLAVILILLIGIGSVLLIYNSFSISVTERTKQFGILASVGATHKQLARSVLIEGLYIGLIGIPLGLLLGLIGTGVTLELSKDLFSSLLASGGVMALVIAWQPLVISLAIGIVTIFLSAYIPARRAAKLSAIDAIRQNTEIVIKKRDVKTSKLSERLLGFEGTLALKNSKRNRRRYRATVISLVVSIVLFISASSYGMYLHEGRDTSITDVGYDLTMDSGPQDERKAQELFDELRGAEGVGSASSVRVLYGTAVAAPGTMSDRYLENLAADNDVEASFLDTQELNYGVRIYAVDDATFKDHLENLKLDPEAFLRTDDPEVLAVQALNAFNIDTNRYESFDLFKTAEPLNTEVEIGGSLERDHGIFLDMEITQFTDSLPANLSQTHNSELVIVLPHSVAKTIDGGSIAQAVEAESPSFFFVTETPSETADAMTGILETYGYSSDDLIDMNEMFEGNRNMLLIIDIFTYSFIIMISLITIANVFNTISTSIHLRRKEFAMLQSVGMTQKSFRRMLRYESVFYGVKALVIGLVLAALVSYAIYLTVMAGADVQFALPWTSVGIGILGVFVVVFITMQYSVTKLKKTNTIDALRTESF